MADENMLNPSWAWSKHRCDRGRDHRRRRGHPSRPPSSEIGHGACHEPGRCRPNTRVLDRLAEAPSHRDWLWWSVWIV